jgi:hypothetical protein
MQGQTKILRQGQEPRHRSGDAAEDKSPPKGGLESVSLSTLSLNRLTVWLQEMERLQKGQLAGAT